MPDAGKASAYKTVAPPQGRQEAGPLAPGLMGAVKLTSSHTSAAEYRPIAKQAIGLLTLFTQAISTTSKWEAERGF